MKKLMIILAITIGASTAYACLKYKQCCRQGLGGLECVQKCEMELCPIGYPIVIQ